MSTARADLVSGGFYVTRCVQPPVAFESASSSQGILSLSPCLAEFLPDVWAFESASDPVAQGEAALRAFGLPLELRSAVERRVRDAHSRGRLGWSTVWQDREAAREFVESLGRHGTNLIVIELAVPADFAAQVLEEFRPSAEQSVPGFLECLRRGVAPDSTGIDLGWELLGVEYGCNLHSWACNGLVARAGEQLGIRTGAFGLICTEADARAVCAWIEAGELGEPVPWFPGLLRRIA
ncbi:MAG: hypothetical protein K8S98_08905 [Planctomycetes bacterium]|nr:hypothetical protein [Planctomycetota bacterium]